MRDHRLSFLIAAFYNAVLLIGLWWLDWPPGVVYALVMAECVLLAVLSCVELVKASSRGRTGAGVGLAALSTVLLLVATAATTVLAAYFCWITGVELSAAHLAFPLVLLVLRYVAEGVIRHRGRGVELPSGVLRRTWIRGGGMLVAVVVSGGLLMLALMRSFPFRLPDSQDDLLHLTPYVEGIDGAVDPLVGAIVLSLVVLAKTVLEYQGLGRRRHGAGQWGWADRVVGAPVGDEEVEGSLIGDAPQRRS